MTTCPRVAIFNLDDTLAASLKAPAPAMTGNLKRLLDRIPTVVMTGRDFMRVEPDFLPFLTDSPHIERFYVFPEGAAECLQWQDGAWQTLYTHTLSGEEFRLVRVIVENCLNETHAYDGLPVFGERFIEKRAMFTLMAVGIDAPTEVLRSWDPKNTRRKKLNEAIARELPEFKVVMGGASAIDISRKGIDKAYGVRWLSERLDIPAREMLFVGDQLEEGGNDSVVIPTGIQTRATSGPEETMKIIDELLVSCG